MRRNSLRLPSYDYRSPGGYFITICTYRRQFLFEQRVLCETAEQAWLDIPNHHPGVETDVFVVMPNHVHGILFLTDGDDLSSGDTLTTFTREGRQYGASSSVATVVRSFKSRVARDAHVLLGTNGEKFWQRNYYEHVIRSERALQRIRQYIVDNPARWEFDAENPDGQPDAREDYFWRSLSLR